MQLKAGITALAERQLQRQTKTLKEKEKENICKFLSQDGTENVEAVKRKNRNYMSKRRHKVKKRQICFFLAVAKPLPKTISENIEVVKEQMGIENRKGLQQCSNCLLVDLDYDIGGKYI